MFPFDSFITRATRSLAFTAVLVLTRPISGSAQTLTPHTIHLADGRTISLKLPPDLTIDVAVQGLRRARFMATSPDNRIFVTDMFNRADNHRGSVYILDGWNPSTHSFAHVFPYLRNLRNPNNLAFYTEPPQSGHPAQSWLYLPLTDKLLRYKYNAGDAAPNSPPEVLATYPDYGLNYKYGGWHLTRTVAFGVENGKPRLFVSVGSSCNACQEKEEIRATLSVMDPDGKNSRIIAHGLRNAVGLNFIPSLDGGALFATNMGADHLGNQSPEDTFFKIVRNDPQQAAPANYGWPTCYFADGSPHPDPAISSPGTSGRISPAPPSGPPPTQFDCTKVPAAYATFPAHSSPLGLEYFDSTAHTSSLHNSFLVALHGASHPSIGTGYRVVRLVGPNHNPQDFITGFLESATTKSATTNGKLRIKGRPCGILRTGPDSFLLTDDLAGVIYSIHPTK